MSNPKKRKFHIQPNSLSESEENSTRNVLQRLRNPSATPKIGEPEIINFSLPEIISDIRDLEGKTSETESIGHPSKKISDVNDNKTRASEIIKNGRPAEKISDTKTPVVESRMPEKKTTTDTKTPEINTSDIRDKSKTVRRAYDASYEEKRKANESIDRMNLRPHVTIGKKIRVFCAEQRLDLTEFFQLAAVQYIENYGHPSNLNSDTKTPLDDRRLRLLYKTRPTIINLYLAYNLVFNEKSKWTVRDDEAASKFNNLDIRLIELGFIQTQGNKQFAGKINSFNYYVPEIESFIEMEMPEASIILMLEVNRQRWAKATGKSLDLSFLDQTAE